MHRKILNFRDLGGIPVSGGVVKPHRLLRGGPLENLSDETVDALLNEYHLTKVIDLRTDEEQERQPNMVFDNVEYVHLDIIGRSQKLSADPAKMLEVHEKATSKHYMCALNEKFISDEHARAEYRQFFQELLSNEEGATFFHCSAGKDRTGFGAAQILKILGASKEAIMKDYLKTNELNGDNRIWMTNKFKEERPEATPEEIEDFQGYITVDESYINTAFRTIDEMYGTFDNYVSEVLNLNDQDILKLKTMYIQEN